MAPMFKGVRTFTLTPGSDGSTEFAMKEEFSGLMLPMIKGSLPDFGPVFETWEADFGRTYVVGSDPAKRRLVADIEAAFARGKDLYRRTPSLTAGELYDHVASLAAEAGWEFGAATAGHLIGHFPHERDPHDLARFSVRRGNGTRLREPDAAGRPRHWILEIHFIDRQRRIGGFFEELLTVDEPAHA